MSALVLPFLISLWSVVSVTPASEPVPVQTARLGEIASYPERSASARVISLNETTVSAEVAARVVELPVRVGDIVDANDSLARLDCADYRFAERQALANLESLDVRIELATKRLERTRALVMQQSLSEEALDERISELAVLQSERKAAVAGHERARLNISRCNIISPFHALVLERISAVGEYVTTGTALLRVMDISDIEVSAQVPNDDIVQINKTSTLFFEYAGRRYSLAVRAILPVINTLTRNREVRLLFNHEPALTGAAGKLIWVDPRPHVPATLLVRRGNSLGIFIDNGGTASFVPLTGAQTGRSTPVELPDSVYLIIDGHLSLEDGMVIRVNSR